jgi:hypothetical protein
MGSLLISHLMESLSMENPSIESLLIVIFLIESLLIISPFIEESL